MNMGQRRASIDAQHPLSVYKQCELLNVSRSQHYYEPKPESALNLRIMRLMDEQYLKHPHMGPRRMQAWLKTAHDISVNLKRVNRLYYSVMGLQSVLPGPHTSRRRIGEGHKIYPYLLKGLIIDTPNQVWQTDITYIGMPRGYLYLSAIIDVFSRYIVHWSLSNTMTTEWCIDLFEQAIALHGSPLIINTDQGAQYTSRAYAESILGGGLTKLSMDGKGRATDNAYIERFWRSVKYEHVYLYDYPCGKTLYQGLDTYVTYYNHERQHSSIDRQTPFSLFSSRA